MTIERGDTHPIDVELLASLIEDSMSQYDLFTSPQRCIFKTPILLYRHNEKAYIPDAFSIGPLHHDRPNFEATEKIKAKYLELFISRSGSPKNTMLKNLINSINALEKDAREYYAEPIGYSKEDFVKMLVTDGCFIIELLCRFSEEREKNDPILSIFSLIEVLSHDLILLENQVPWMVLEHLFSIGIADIGGDIPSLIELAMAFFVEIFPFLRTGRPDHDLRDIKHIPDLFKKQLVPSIKVDQESKPLTSQRTGRPDHDLRDIKHVSCMFKKCQVSSVEEDEENISPSEEWKLLPSATRLREAGIKFRMSKSKNMFDIKFTRGVLEIPPIRVHESTETFFRNIISFEQCYPDNDGMITSYAMLLDNLIDTAKDVEILSKNHILNIWLNPEDAVQFFNKLYHDACVQTYYYDDLCNQVSKFCQRRWPRWRRALMHNYFNNPWAVLSTLAAAFLLILSFLQTFYTMKS